MDTFVLHIRRQAGLVAAAMSTKVIIDGSQRTSLRVGGVEHFTLPRRPVNVMLLNQVPLGKDIEKLITIDPRDSTEVTLMFTYKFNVKSMFFLNAFTKPTAFIDTEIIYGPSISGQPAPSSVATDTPSESVTPAGDAKFCTECGASNPKEAKFCQNCGNKFG